MKHKILLTLGVALLIVALSVTHISAQGPQPRAPRAALGTAFTYQGQLKDGGSPANGAYDFEFALFDAASGGAQIGSTVNVNDLTVTNGLFTTPLNFGTGAFNGDARYLEVRVRPGSSTGSYTTLTPRQQLNPAPYALYAKSAPWSGLTGIPTAWLLTGNSGTTPGTHFIGTTDNQALEFKVNHVRVLRLEPTGSTPNLIGGYSGNNVTSGVNGATISGGGSATTNCGGGTDPCTNRVTDDYGTVGGGRYNQAGDNLGTTSDRAYATVGGGVSNIASGDAATVGGGLGNTASGFRATVGGGSSNIASGSNATVGGGNSNIASDTSATVGGGNGNTASGQYATVGGGFLNTAAGDYSFVVGRRAKNTDATHDGVFLFADSTNADLTSTTANQFLVRASGGITMYTNSAMSVGVKVNPGSGTWSSISDRAAKENFAKVNSREILARVAALPIQTWNYKSQDDAIRHIGPIAQDFYAAFQVGEDDKHITTIDADGVALAAIQGLYGVVQEKDAEIANLKSQISNLEARLAALERGAGVAHSSAPDLNTLGLGVVLLGALGIVVYPRVRRRA